MPNTLQHRSPSQHTGNAQYVAEYDMAILNLELQILAARRKGILSLQECDDFEENLHNIVKRTNEHNSSSGFFLQGLALSRELMSSRVPLTQGIMTILSPIWSQGGFHRVRIDRRILELKDLERVVSMVSEERVPMYQIYRIVNDHILPKEIDNKAECFSDVPDVVGYHMDPMDIYDKRLSLRNDLRKKYYVETGPMIIELIRETLSLVRPDTNIESATLLSKIQNIALTEIVTLANFMYHNPRQHDDTLSCMKTIRNFIASCVNHQTSEDVVEYVQNMLTSDSILRIKYYGISSAFTRGRQKEEHPPFTGDIDIPTIKLELKNLGLLVIDKHLGHSIDRSEPFGSGGFGSVYKITTTEDTVKRNGSKKVLVEVVIKEHKRTGYASNELMLKRFLREARVCAKAQPHPNIVPTYACWISNGPYPILVTEYCNGGTFYEFIRKTTSKMSEKLKLQLDVAKGLYHLHSLEVPGPIIHGDLKSDNVLINNSCALICDFGISEVHDDRKGLTTENHGSSYYTAPEVLKAISNGKRVRLTKESDVYSFGCLYLEVLTGQLPFYGVDLDKLHDMPQSEWWRMMPQVKGTSVTDRDFLSLCWDDNLACRPYMNEAIVMLDSKLKQAIREEQAMSQKAKSKPKPFWRIWG